MRIAQVMLAKGFGGAERSFVDISKALLARGHEVVVVCEQRAAVTTMFDPAVVTTLRVHGHWDPLAARKLARLFRRQRVEIVHAHLARAAKIAGRAAQRCGIPALVKTHNYVDLKYYSAIDCLVPTTQDQVEYLIEKGIAPSQLRRIPNFTAMPLADTAHRIESGQPVRIVAVGRLVHKKGFDLLLRAVAGLAGRYRLSIEIVGDGPERNALEALTRELGLQQIVSFAGWQREVRLFLDRADLFVLPSRDEPFGIVCLEAMAAGKPIVATETQGPREILDHNVAVLVPIDDDAALRVAIEDVLDDPSSANERAAAALERCRQHYTEEVVVEQYLDLYRDLLAQAR